jgi:hypothetical protein
MAGSVPNDIVYNIDNVNVEDLRAPSMSNHQSRHSRIELRNTTLPAEVMALLSELDFDSDGKLNQKRWKPVSGFCNT